MAIKRAIFLSAMTVVLAAALIGGGTMAWFTDTAETEQASFQAGTLLIEAGTTSLYGVEYGEGNENLYEVLIDQETEEVNKIKIFESEEGTYLNGLAYDNANHRLYYADEYSNLYFYDFDDKETKAGSLNDHTVWGATFGDGYYWYVEEGTDDLYKVSFEEDGSIDETTLEAEDFTGDENKEFGFGDLAMEMREGIIYGSTSGHDGTDEVFFSYNIHTEEYNSISTSQEDDASTNLQIAFGTDGEMYGHLTRQEKWYEVDQSEGIKSEFYEGEIQLSDLASSYQSNWNPGDTDMARFYVTNTGTKDSYIRAELTGEWKNDLDDDNIEISLCEGMDDWEKEEDGKFYYQQALEPEERVLLCVNIHLDGPGTGNEYQDEKFELKPKFEAIQESNEASESEWGWSPDED